MCCSFLMVKMVGILKFLLTLEPLEDIDHHLSRSAAIMHIDCIPDLESNHYYEVFTLPHYSVWTPHGL